jgi:hypothetical protein
MLYDRALTDDTLWIWHFTQVAGLIHGWNHGQSLWPHGTGTWTVEDGQENCPRPYGTKLSAI